MSWDSTFNYEHTYILLPYFITQYTNELVELDALIAQYSSLSEEQMNQVLDNYNLLVKKRSNINDQLTSKNDMLTKLNNFNLSNIDKANLYQIYILSDDQLYKFAVKQLVYSTELLTEGVPILSLSVSTSIKRELISAICKKYDNVDSTCYIHVTYNLSSPPPVPFGATVPVQPSGPFGTSI